MSLSCTDPWVSKHSFHMPCSELTWSIKKVAKKKISWEELSCSFPWLQAIRAWLNEIANQTTSFLSKPECRDVLFLLSSGDDVFLVITVYYQNSLTAGIGVTSWEERRETKRWEGKVLLSYIQTSVLTSS